MNVINMVDLCLKQVNEALDTKLAYMTKLEYELSRAFKVCLENADYYEISNDINEFAKAMVLVDEDNKGSLDDIKLDQDSKAPSDICVLYVGDDNGIFVSVKNNPRAKIETEVEEAYHIFSLIPAGERSGLEKMRMEKLGGYTTEPFDEEGNYVFLSDFQTKYIRDSEHHAKALGWIVHVANCFSIINQPRFVIQSPAATRQQRKYMMNARKIPTGAWNKIEWNITEPVYAPNESKQGGWNMPLHYKRGHWRKAEAHWDDVVIRKDGKPYKWIEGYWAGHPAFGIQRSYHAPKLGKNHEAIYA